jgi:hypothetical protein
VTVPSTPVNVTPAISDYQRQTQQRLRDSFWDGTWEETLREDVRKVLTTERAEVVGVVDMSCCLGPQISRELAVCYLRAPSVTRNGKAAKLTEPGGPVERALLWSMMPDFQGRVLWLREYVMRLDVTADSSLLFRPVPPWLVDIEADPAKPDQPIVYREWVPRTIRGEDVWTRDVIDLKDPENPILKVTSEDGTEDLTAEVFGGERSGEDYPYRWADGTPWMPVELYHRDPDAQLWHFSQGVEIVSATRMAAVFWTLFSRDFRDCSYDQRAIIDGRPLGIVPKGDRGIQYVVPDPTLVLLIESVEGKQAQLAQWKAPSQPADLIAGIQGYIAQATTREGVSPAELQRLSGDPQSGYAIALTNAGKRQAQSRFGPQFRIRDESLLCKAAALWNRSNPEGEQHPEEGYQVSYQSIPLSPDEERAIRDQVDWELKLGWVTPAQALARVRCISETEAKAIIAANSAEQDPDNDPPDGG